MSGQSNIHPEVRAAVLAWANAADLRSAADRLATARRLMDADRVALLRSEVAEITVESLVELLALARGATGSATVAVPGIGLRFYRKQAERLGAWLNDQGATAKALGLDIEAWTRTVQRGLTRYLQAARWRSAGELQRARARRIGGA